MQTNRAYSLSTADDVCFFRPLQRSSCNEYSWANTSCSPEVVRASGISTNLHLHAFWSFWYCIDCPKWEFSTVSWGHVLVDQRPVGELKQSGLHGKSTNRSNPWAKNWNLVQSHPHVFLVFSCPDGPEKLSSELTQNPVNVLAARCRFWISSQTPGPWD